MSTWYKTKSTSSGLKHDANLYSYEQQQTLLTRIAVVGFIFVYLLLALVVCGIALSEAASHQQAAPTAANADAASTAQPPPAPPKPNLFVWLRDVEGLELDPCASSPAFKLVVDADGVPPRYRHCSGGGNSMLRVSHRGIILAWGHVPSFCVEAAGSQSQSEEEHGFVDGVVTVKARADGAVLREEVRRSIQNDLCAEGKAHFSVEGEVTGLGYLRCETSLFQRNDTEESYPCLVQ